MVIRLKLKSPDLFLRTYKTTIQRRKALGVALLTLVCICFNLFIFGCSGSLLLLRLSLVVAGGGYSQLGAQVLVVVVSLTEEHRLQVCGLRSCSSWALEHQLSRLGCSAACGILLDPGSNRIPCIGRQSLIYCTTSTQYTVLMF